ncbi:MAG: IPT/TIG domain-containing protein, partial [Rhodoferax sp.]|nr:IPT/TIG domain-containing protein [Rhodoferax sp.]
MPVWVWVSRQLAMAAAVLVFTACGGGGGSSAGAGAASTSLAPARIPAPTPPLRSPVSNPLPVLQGIFPSSAKAGAAPLVLTVTGSNFSANSTVQWNGDSNESGHSSTLSTFFVSATQLMATVPANQLSSSGSASVAVLTAAPGGGTSAAIGFSIDTEVGNAPMPASAPMTVITALAPASASVGAGDTLFTLHGSHFNADSVVQWNGTALASTWVSAMQLTAQLPASKLATATLATVTVSSGKARSNAMGFVVAAPMG